MIYLLQNESAGYIGDSPLFWSDGGCGYTVDVDRAKRFTLTEARAVVRASKGTHRWKIWRQQDVLNSCVRVADIEVLRQSKVSTVVVTR
jgi:hypothetical protein